MRRCSEPATIGRCSVNQTGISQLQIDPSLGGNNSDPDARLAIQERLKHSFHICNTLDQCAKRDRAGAIPDKKPTLVFADPR
jgi:hypothetical protein